jgi:hypothetical protein
VHLCLLLAPSCLCLLSLPAAQLNAPLTVDMRGFPPSVAEAYTHVLMAALEARSKPSPAAVPGSSPSRVRARRAAVAQPVRLLVPPFDSNYVMWPSYVGKLFLHYSEQLLERQVGSADLALTWHSGRWYSILGASLLCGAPSLPPPLMPLLTQHIALQQLPQHTLAYACVCTMHTFTVV